MKLTCCKPYKEAYGSGHHWTHSRWCQLWPGRKVADTPAIEADGPPVRLAPTKDTEPRRMRRPVVTAIRPLKAHPACLAAVDEGATPCSRCSWLLEIDNEGSRYVDAHVDD